MCINSVYPDKPDAVLLFGTCLIDSFYPDAGMATVQLLEREGLQVKYPQRQTCCGQPAWNSGFDREARDVAAAQIKIFEGELPVVVPSASCAGMIRYHYPALFANTPLSDAAIQLANRVFELSEFLIHICKVTLQDKGRPIKVVLHNSCSAQRETRTAQDTRSLLVQLANVGIVQQDRASECCGFGGTFAVKAPSISNAMVQDKCDSLMATDAQQMITGDCGCMMNITGALKKRGDKLPGKHIATFLWERTR